MRGEKIELTVILCFFFLISFVDFIFRILFLYHTISHFYRVKSKSGSITGREAFSPSYNWISQRVC